MILVVDDDKVIRVSLSLLLRRAGYEVECAASPDEALAAVRASAARLQLVVMDMNYSGTTSGEEGLELLRKIRVLQPDVPVILITAWGTIPLAVEGIKAGAFDFISKPWNSHILLGRIATALTLSAKSPAAAADVDSFDRCGIIGESRAIREVLSTVARVAPTDASVLITGENGTGKELIARALHVNSRRAARPFVMVNLGGISQSLFESEMFGHVRGAFSGAVASRKGRFELADTGTIFLDEIGDLDLSCQVKLLRVLQQHTFEPLGESRPRSVDARVICATNADLAAMVAEGRFREDLLYRINLITIHLPPLRERADDIPLLVRHFAEQARRGSGATPEFADDAMTLLSRLPYRGNIRELKNLVERAVLLSDRRVIRAADIDLRGGGAPIAAEVSAAAADGAVPYSPGMTLDEVERTVIINALREADGNLSRVADTLGISRQALYRRIEKYGIRVDKP